MDTQDEVRRLRERVASLEGALRYFVMMFGETPDGEWALQIMEDPSTMTGTLARARAALPPSEKEK